MKRVQKVEEEEEVMEEAGQLLSSVRFWTRTTFIGIMLALLAMAFILGRVI